MDPLVRLVSSSTNYYSRVWMTRNRIDFFKKSEGRYHVYQSSLHGRVRDRELLGVVFREACIWVFVPHEQKLKMNWYFGKTRADAVSGFLKAADREVSGDES